LTESWLERAVERIKDQAVWRAVETIAGELEKKHFLSGTEVQQFFEGSTGKA
jgi:hypothetical protein